MKPIELPTLGYFKNGNGYLGSAGLLRYQLENSTPKREADRVEGQVYELTAVLWQGPFSRPYAQEIGREAFPITEDGLTALTAFLDAQAQSVNDAPPFTTKETDAYYWEKKSQDAASRSE